MKRENLAILSYGAILGAFVFTLHGCSKQEPTGVQLTASVQQDVDNGRAVPPPPEEKSELDKIQEAGRTEAEAHGAAAPPQEAPPQEEASNGMDAESKDWDQGYNTKEFKVQHIFTIGNCKVYRFYPYSNSTNAEFFQDCAH